MDGGVVWTDVPAGAYTIRASDPSTRFGSFVATCKPGRIVNANPPWGLYELGRSSRATSRRRRAPDRSGRFAPASGGGGRIVRRPRGCYEVAPAAAGTTPSCCISAAAFQ